MALSGGLHGKVCVITGGGGGVGLAMARRFQLAGMNVVIGDVEADALDGASSELGTSAVAVRCDVTSQASMDELRDAALGRFGAVHVVCLNAGVAPVGLLLETSLETWRWALDVNVMGVVHGVRSFGPLLLRQGEGHIVCTASSAGLSTSYAFGAYSATKHAVVAIATTLRKELHAGGVGVSVLCPGPLRTRIAESERNRPEELTDETNAATAEFVARFKKAVAAAPDPAMAADAVYDAVLEDRLFVIPSPEMNDLITQRLDEIRAAITPERQANHHS